MAEITNQLPDHIQKANIDVSHLAMQAVHPINQQCTSKKFTIFLKPDRVIAKCFYCEKEVAHIMIATDEEQLKENK